MTARSPLSCKLRAAGQGWPRYWPWLGLLLGLIAASPRPGHGSSTDTDLRQATPATLKRDRTFSYPFAQVWPTTIRHLRVDRDYELPERDKEAGYLLFTKESTDERGEPHRLSGHIELVIIEGSEGPQVRVYVSTRGGGPHLPFTILDGIDRKLSTEYGRPRRNKKIEPAPKK